METRIASAERVWRTASVVRRTSSKVATAWNWHAKLTGRSRVDVVSIARNRTDATYPPFGPQISPSGDSDAV